MSSPPSPGRSAALASGCALAVALAVGCMDPSADLGQTAGLEVLLADSASGSADGIGGAARVWGTAASLRRCAVWAVDEDFASGRYTVHRYRTSLPAGGAVSVRLARLAGAWSPAVVVADSAGDEVFDGEAAAAHGVVAAEAVSSGRDSDAAEVTLSASSPIELNVYVTSWEALASAFETSLPRDARYRLEMAHECSEGEPGAGWDALHAGLESAGVPLPRQGLRNSTLRASLGIATEPYGAVVDREGLAFVSGRVSWFGGPRDTGVSSSETGAITGERLRSLNVPLDPSDRDLASRPGDFYFAAMRFDYGPAGRSFWLDARLLVVNPATGRAVVVRPVDWGPNTRTRRVLDLSPQAMSDLGLVTDETALVAFARSTAPLGRVE